MIRILSLTCALALLLVAACVLTEPLDRAQPNLPDGAAGSGSGGSLGNNSTGGRPAADSGAEDAGGCPVSCSATQACVSGGCVSVVGPRPALHVEGICNSALSGGVCQAKICTGPVSEEVCQSCSDAEGFSASDAVSIGGPAGVTYDLSVEISGAFELVGYTGGTFGTTTDHLRDGGTVTDSTYNSVELDVGARRTYLNSLPDACGPIGSPVLVTGLRTTLTVTSGDTLTLRMSSRDCAQATTCSSGCFSRQVDGRDLDAQIANVRFVSASAKEAK